MKSDFPLSKASNWKPPVIAVVGMGTCPGDLSETASQLIERAQVLAGGRRHLELFSDHPGEKIHLGSPISEHLDLIGRISETRRIVVLASGDPLFFGIGRKIVEKFGRERLMVVPNVTSIQVLCAKLCEPWDGIETVSLHGRSAETGAFEFIIEKLAQGRNIAVFTDPVHTPQWIGKRIAELDGPECTITVGEDLGSPRERIREFSPANVANETFSDLNLVLIRPAASTPTPSCVGLGDRAAGRAANSSQIFGFPETEFEREAGLITKMEIRAVALALLRLGPGQVLWDLGAGTGSISIEAARIAPLRHVFAVEKNESRYAKLLENIRNFGASGVDAIQGGAPEALERLPDPDRVFIGGGGKALPEILETVSERLIPGGRVVHTIVLFETLEKVKKFWIDRGFDISLIQLQVSRSAPIGKDLRLESLNPVFILSAWRK